MSEKLDRRSRIIASATAEFAEHGLAGARVQRIADRAGVNKQLVYYYFESKGGLYRHVMSLAAGQLSAEAQAWTSSRLPTGQLRTVMGNIAEFLSARPHLLRLLLLDLRQSAAAREQAAELGNGLTARIARVISQGQGAGYFKDDADPDATARLALGLLLGHLALASVSCDDYIRDLPDGLVRMVLRSLTW
jgi:AcrR family transcriptional regulator